MLDPILNGLMENLPKPDVHKFIFKKERPNRDLSTVRPHQNIPEDK